MDALTALLLMLGGAAVAVGVALVSVPAGVITAGLLLMAAGVLSVGVAPRKKRSG